MEVLDLSSGERHRHRCGVRPYRNTVDRLARRLSVEGMSAVVPAKRGPKGPSKVTPQVLDVIAKEGSGVSANRLAHLVHSRTGVTLSPSYVSNVETILASRGSGSCVPSSQPTS